jgi:hypothetical protein
VAELYTDIHLQQVCQLEGGSGTRVVPASVLIGHQP